jgi:methionyl aminopeptidase
MRASGRIVAETLALLESRIKPGVTSAELDRMAERECLRQGAKPAFKGYGGFPFAICASPNNRVVHGFPNNEPLQEGDILSIDFGVLFKGFYGDSAITVAVGEVTGATRRLLDATRDSLQRGIEKSISGGRLSDVSHAVQAWVEPLGFSVVREFVGHGIGRKLHEAPQIPNYGAAGQGPRLKSGMTLAIEPMINAGEPAVHILDDGWTAVTRDGSFSAHFEHTVAITEKGPEILTRV